MKKPELLEQRSYLHAREREVIRCRTIVLPLLTALKWLIIPFTVIVQRSNNRMQYRSRVEIITQILEIVDEGSGDVMTG